jgi:hypothetical protein
VWTEGNFYSTELKLSEVYECIPERDGARSAQKEFL